MHAHQVIKNDFLNDLKDDFVAVNQAGHVVSRANTRTSLEQAVKNFSEPVHIFSAADFAPAPTIDPTAISEEMGPTIVGHSVSDTQTIKVEPTAKKAALKK